MAGILYLCATPIGNLEDITYRVLRTLKEVDLIAAEDTRNSIKLLNHFEIQTPMTSYHEFNKIEKAYQLVAKLKLPAFIATLGTMMLSRGLSAIIAAIPNIFYFSRPEDDGVWFKRTFSNADGIPTGLFWVLGFTLICMYLMYKCKIGRYILSIGSNEEATRLSGINTDRFKVIAYTIGGMTAGIAAIFWAASFT